MAKTKKMSEEELERRRIARKEKYKNIKNNPQLYAIEQEKKRKYYLKRKETGKIKNITEMSPREQRVRRRKWKVSAKKYYDKKKKEKDIEMAKVNSDNNNPDIVEDIRDNDNQNIKPMADPLDVDDEKPIRTKLELKLINKIKTLKLQHLKEKRNLMLLLKKCKSRIKYLQRHIFTLSNKTSNNLENIDKKPLFDKLLSDTLVEKFATTKSRKEKRIITNLINKNKFKELKVATNLRSVCLRKRFKKTLGNFNMQKMVELFYEDDINSRITPGKKQYKKKSGIVKQIRYLLDSMKNLHKKFLDENPNIKISYTTFTRLRPFWVLLPVDDRDTCACTLHTNLNLLVAALNKHNILNIKDGQDLINAICCDKYNADCLSRKCSVCKDKTVTYEEFHNDKQIQYMEWEKDIKTIENKKIKIIKKKTKKSDPYGLILKLENVIPKFVSHVSNIVNQYNAIKSLKESLNNNEALIHMDFSENYAFKYGEEVQSMHFGGSRGQVCLHTAVIYLRNELSAVVSHSLCTVSECLRHDAPAVWAHLNYLINFVYVKSPQINRIHILTDSPTSQYRNKYIFYIITQLKTDFPKLNVITWNYQEAGHGKGAPDGIGAVVKRTADYQVKCHQDVGNFDVFIEVIKNIKNVAVGVIQEQDIKIKDILLPKNIKTFKGTMDVHQVVWAENSSYLEFRRQSCFECINMGCTHSKHIRHFKIYDSPTSVAIENVNIIPENKRIRILNDITISYTNNINPTSHISQAITSLRSVRRSWQNQTFTGNFTKASGHEQEFQKFIEKAKDYDDSSN